MKVVLKVVEGPESGRVFEFFEADSFLAGRSPKTHFILDAKADQKISRTHFMLDVRPPRCLIRDLESKNGTFVNQRRISNQELVDGDQIRIGGTVIEVGIVDPNGAAHRRCSSCGTAVETGDAVDNHPSRAISIVLCPTCREVQEFCLQPDDSQPANAEPAKTDIPPGLTPDPLGNQGKVALTQPLIRATSAGPPRPTGRPQAANVYPCAACGRDLTGRATSDGWAAQLPHARYLCPTCTIRKRSDNVNQTHVGRYRVLRELGRGGMGIVYKAVHESTRRICAVKQILPDAARDEKALRMFEREVGVQSVVVHPNLARVLERGRHQDSCFFATEFLEGGDASQLVTRDFKGPVSPRLACRITLQILAGVDALHQHGFVHRDLKPSNFLLSRHHTDPTAVAKITDYGLAKSYEEAGNSMFDYTRAGDIAGSMMFMPPEQITDYRFVRPPTDVYAVGVSLYFLLTSKYTVDFPAPGQRAAFAGGGAKGRNPIQVILEDPPIPIALRLPQLPPAIAGVVDKAVQKDLDRRFTTAAEFADELERAVICEGLA